MRQPVSSNRRQPLANRRQFLAAATAACAGRRLTAGQPAHPDQKRPAQIAITFDLEMSRHYPRRGMTEWDYQKGNLDEPTKQYAVRAGQIVKELGGVVHYFCVGRVLEQPDVAWLRQLAAAGHAVGNHTYDHVYLLADSPEKTQFRFQRAPWLIAGRSVRDILYENIRITDTALQARTGIKTNGFRTPGGFSQGLNGREDLQDMLQELGFNWVSAQYPPHPMPPARMEPTAEIYEGIAAAQERAQPYRYPTGLVEIPMSPVSDVNAFRTNFWKLDWFLEATRRSVNWAIETGGVFDFLCHPSCLVVEDPEFRTVRLICELVRAAGRRATITTLDQIARRVSA